MKINQLLRTRVLQMTYKPHKAGKSGTISKMLDEMDKMIAKGMDEFAPTSKKKDNDSKGGDTEKEK